MWGALGDLQFSLLGGPYEFQDKQEAEFAEHPILGDAPRLQFMGRKLEEITLKIRLHPLLTSNPDLDLRSLRDSMVQGDIQELVIGQEQSGTYAGKFVITSLEHDRLEQWPNGRLRMADVTVQLKEWVKAPELGISSRKTPPAIKRKGQAPPPSTQTKTEKTRYGQGKQGKP
jgi:phage protein U